MLWSYILEFEELHRNVKRRKIATIRKIKQKEFREHIATATDSQQEVYRLVKWARLKADHSRELSQFL